MSDPATATETQLRNIEAATGLSRDALFARVEASGLEKHGQVVAFLKSDLGMTYGNANLIATLAAQAQAGGPLPPDELLAAQYAGGKARLRPILDAISTLATGCGDDVETVVHKTGVSFRRRKQFALVEARSSTRVQLGLNLRDAPVDPRIVPMDGMCTHKVDLAGPDEVDASLASAIRAAYEAAA
jgi:hypothetical protein